MINCPRCFSKQKKNVTVCSNCKFPISVYMIAAKNLKKNYKRYRFCSNPILDLISTSFAISYIIGFFLDWNNLLIAAISIGVYFLFALPYLSYLRPVFFIGAFILSFWDSALISVFLCLANLIYYCLRILFVFALDQKDHELVEMYRSAIRLKLRPKEITNIVLFNTFKTELEPEDQPLATTTPQQPPAANRPLRVKVSKTPKLKPLQDTSSEKEYVYVEAANGMTVRIPLDKLDAWKKGQERLRAGEGLSEAGQQMAKELRALMEKNNNTQTAKTPPLPPAYCSNCHKSFRSEICPQCGAKLKSTLITK